MRTPAIIFINFWFLVDASIAGGQVTNLVIPPSAGPITNRQSVVVGSNQVAKIHHIKLAASQCRLNIKVGGQILRYDAFDVAGSTAVTTSTGTVGLPMIAGPAEIELELILTSPGSTTSSNLCVVQLSNNGEQFTPSNAVVIPADSGGPVEIILESSVDLITWTPANPGVYGGSTEKRFFRVRAARR